MSPNLLSPSIRVRTLFLSDVHLGTLECQAERLLRLLQSFHAERIFLVGDIIDFWSLRNSVHWPPSHSAVLKELIERARAGTRVIFIPGNHDELCRDFCGQPFQGIEIEREFTHQLADGRRLLVLHGDEFDAAVQCGSMQNFLGSWLYDLLLRWGYRLNGLRRAFGLPHWSLVTWLKNRVSNVRQHVERFERAAVEGARRRGFEGVVCGHIHRPAMEQRDGLLYCNVGDWVEHCTAITEGLNGELRLWTEQESQAAAHPETAPLKRAA
jgi:UDP-2,3-diacylglucosamine pyrophosphatase LpxH